MPNYLSFDIGEVNFAYCFGTKTTDTVEITSFALHNIKRKNKQPVLESSKIITQLLDEAVSNSLFNKSTIILVEQQLGLNIRCKLIAQHIWSYFYLKYDQEVLFIHPREKINHFSTSPPKDRKKWSICKTTELLQESPLLDSFQKLKKKDDVSDCILQFIAFASTYDYTK